MHIYTHNHIHTYIDIHIMYMVIHMCIYIYIVCGSIIYNTIPYYMILYQIIIWLFQHIICIGTTNYVHSNTHMFICTYQYHTLYKYCINICIFVIPIHTSQNCILYALSIGYGVCIEYIYISILIQVYLSYIYIMETENMANSLQLPSPGPGGSDELGQADPGAKQYRQYRQYIYIDSTYIYIHMFHRFICFHTWDEWLR